MITFTNINWRGNSDKEVFNIHALKSITLDGLNQGIVTIEGASGRFKAPYYKLYFGGGVEHFTFITQHPYKIGEFVEIAIFENKVCVIPANNKQESWFEHKCRTYIPTF